MMRRLMAAAVLLFAFFFSSCTTGKEATVTPRSNVGTEVNLDLRGHAFYTLGEFDSAAAVFQRLLKLDPENKIALRDLGNMQYDLATMDNDEKSPSRIEHLRTSRRYYAQLEQLGEHDLELYDRLCETSLALRDNKGFLSYAKESAGRYPFDRQYHNLGLAYFDFGDYQSVIKVEKEAIEKFKTSPYLSSYYRQLGRAYMKVDRDQTAERILEEGVDIANMRLQGRAEPDDYRRLMEDKTGMLLSLKRLYQTYHKEDKLKAVERQLLEAGYTGHQRE